MNQKRIGEFISKLRKEKNLTQAGLGEILGVSNRTVSKWENGDGMPDIAMLQDLAKALDISVDELLSAQKKEMAELKVTEIESKNTTENWFQITNIIALFLGIFSAILSFVTLAYNIWAFYILFYNHWEIIFVVLSLISSVTSVLFFSIGVTKLKLTYAKNEIIKIAEKKGFTLALINSVLPYMFLLRIIGVVTKEDTLVLIFSVPIAIIWFIALHLVRRKINEKNK